MAEEKAFNRWLIVVGAILIQLCLGGIYIWSVFRKPLEMAVDEGGLGLSPSQATLPFSLVLIFFAIATVIGGRWQDKAGPRLVASVGGILLGAGMLLSAFGKSYPALALGYGVIGGIGIGADDITGIVLGGIGIGEKHITIGNRLRNSNLVGCRLAVGLVLVDLLDKGHHPLFRRERVRHCILLY